MRYVFEDFELDTQGYELRQGGELRSLEPQGFNVLIYLIEHRDRVVSKTELLEQLWPGQYVSEATLVQRVVAARRALGDSGRVQHYIKTVHGRGYRFIAAIDKDSSDVTISLPVRSSTMPIVGRETELATLEDCFRHVLQGHRQLVFITGEAGIGKTTLVDAFVPQIASRMPIWVGRGQCIDHYGGGEPYLPLLDALGQLCRGTEGELFLSILRQQAPSWLLQMPALLSTAESEALERRNRGATQTRMLRELAEAVEALASEKPLILVLEDLHWSDDVTLDWLAFVARRRTSARLLILGTYRPSDAIAQGHRVNPIVRELKHQGASVELLLGYLPETGVRAYLSQRFDNASWPVAFVRSLHRRTNGNPFFLVAIVDEWLRQGVLVYSSDGGRLPSALPPVSMEIPDSIQHLIEQQLGALSDEDQEILEVASIVGVEFAAADVAAGVSQEIETIEMRCDAWARQGQFIRAGETKIWADETVTTVYEFLHALYQEVLYEQVPTSRQVRWHQQIGDRLEKGYGPQARLMAVELAEHFVRGRDVQRAVRYLQYAGEQAMQRSASQEAIRHLTLALEWIEALPNTPERTEQEIALYNTMGGAWSATKGYGASEAADAYSQARALGQTIGDSPQLAPILYGLMRFYGARGEHHTSREMAKQLSDLSERIPDPTLSLAAFVAMGMTSYLLGELTYAQEWVTQGMARYESDQHRSHLVQYGEDLRVQCLRMTAWLQWLLGYPDQALRSVQRALDLAQDVASPIDMALAQFSAVILYRYRRELHQVQTQAETLTALAEEHELPYWKAAGMMFKGWALMAQGQEDAMVQITEGLSAWLAMGTGVYRPYFLGLLAEAYGRIEQPEAGLSAVAEALSVVEMTEERLWEAELYRLHGELLLKSSLRDTDQAETCLYQALDIARSQGARSLELRAAKSLARLWQQQDKHREARDLLAPIYGWFTEGFDTADLQESQTLLKALSM